MSYSRTQLATAVLYADAVAGPMALRLFIASPGDLANERACVKACIEEVALAHTGTALPQLTAVGWEDTSGAARRPQEVINEELRRSDYLIVLFKSEWGSPSGSPWGYTSGTEEELFTGLLALQDRDAPLRDVLLIFVDNPAPATEIVALKEQLKRRHGIYYEVVNGIDELRATVKQRLKTWSEDSTAKHPRTVELTPSSGKDVLRADADRRDGLQLADMGFTDEARLRLEAAAATGDPRSMLDLARFLFRIGQPEQAELWNMKVIELSASTPGGLFSVEAAKAYSNLGLIDRNGGNPSAAVLRHRSALDLLSGSDVRSQETRADVLDVLGLALQDSGEYGLARAAFQESLTVRTSLGDPTGVAQSEINLARSFMNDSDLASASDHCAHALNQLEGTAPSGLLANAYALDAQLHARRGDHVKALSQGQLALTLNRQLGNLPGQAVCLNLLAQSQLKKGDLAEAAASAAECLRVNQDIRSLTGEAHAHHLLARVLVAQKQWTDAQDHFKSELALRQKGRPNPTRLAWTLVELSGALSQSGDTEGARRALVEAADHAPSDNERLQDVVREALQALSGDGSA